LRSSGPWRRICERLGWADLTLQPDRNASGRGRISTDDSRLAAYVIATDEERLIAREAARLLGWAGLVLEAEGGSGFPLAFTKSSEEEA